MNIPKYKQQTIVLTRGKHGRIELFNGMRKKAGKSTWKTQWYMRVRGRNGRILATSEGYNRKFSARKCYVALLAFFHS